MAPTLTSCLPILDYSLAVFDSMSINRSGLLFRLLSHLGFLSLSVYIVLSSWHPPHPYSTSQYPYSDLHPLLVHVLMKGFASLCTQHTLSLPFDIVVVVVVVVVVSLFLIMKQSLTVHWRLPLVATSIGLTSRC